MGLQVGKNPHLKVGDFCLAGELESVTLARRISYARMLTDDPELNRAGPMVYNSWGMSDSQWSGGQAGADNGWTVQRIVQWTAGFFTRKAVDSPRLSAELLLSHVLGIARIKLYTDFDRLLSEPELTAYRALVQRAAQHEPIAYLTGTAHFFNLEFQLNREVLIPRPDSETLVENVLQLARHEVGLESPRILDLCTGSGCIAAALARHLNSAVVVATESSPAAAELARANIQRLGLAQRVSVELGDLFAPLKSMIDKRPFDLIVSNPPYIPTGRIADLPANVRDYEPHMALDGGVDGLDLHRRILAESAGYLADGGRIFLEIGFDQGPAALEAAGAGGVAGWSEVRILKDSAGHDRVLAGRKGRGI